MGGWIGLIAVLLLGPRTGRYGKQGQIAGAPPSSIPFLALGAWVLAVGWSGFNVMSAQTIDKISGPVAEPLMAMVGGTLLVLLIGQLTPVLPTTAWPRLAGLVAVLRGLGRDASLGALTSGRHRGCHLRLLRSLTQNKWKIDDVLLGVWLRAVRRLGRRRGIWQQGRWVVSAA